MSDVTGYDLRRWCDYMKEVYQQGMRAYDDQRPNPYNQHHPQGRMLWKRWNSGFDRARSLKSKNNFEG